MSLIKDLIEEADQDREIPIKILHERKEPILEKFRLRNPARYDEFVEMVGK